jgi:cytochrome P450
MTAAEDISSTRDHFTDFDMDSPEFNEQYDQVLDDMLERCPVAHSTVGRGYYVVNRQADVRRVAQDWKTFSSRDGMYPNRPAGMPPVLPEEVDPPYHKNWRVALNKHFSAKRVAGCADSIREQVTALIDGFVERGNCDFVAEFAALLPGRVFFATLPKAPLDDLAALVSVVDDAIMGTPEQQGPAWTELHRYIDGYLEQRQDQPPRDDFVDAILAGVPDGTGEPCSWDDKVNVATLFLSGAVGTTASAIAGVALHLATHPQDREYLAAHPEAHGPAVEELIRIHSPVVALAHGDDRGRGRRDDLRPWRPRAGQLRLGVPGPAGVPDVLRPGPRPGQECGLRPRSPPLHRRPPRSPRAHNHSRRDAAPAAGPRARAWR